MKLLLIIGILVGPFSMYYVSLASGKFKLLFNILAILSIMIFGIIASLSVYQVIVDNTVLMTNIHSIFLNHLFLIASSYIGLYILYRMLLLTMEEL